MNVTIPTLRSTTLLFNTTLTVPAGKTYIIKNISPTGLGHFQDAYTVQIKIGSNTFTGGHVIETGAGMTLLWRGNFPSGVMGSPLVLNASDTIKHTGSVGTIRIWYWELQADFGVDFSIPSLREDNTIVNKTWTVPAGETWILKLALFYVEITRILGGSSDYAWAYATLNGTVMDLFKAQKGSGTDDEEMVGNIVPSTLVLNSGDSITLTINFATL